MYIPTIFTKLILVTIICFFCLNNLKAGTINNGVFDTKKLKHQDTSKIENYLIVNKNFNEVYTQNLRLATFGNEYFGPRKTQLTSDLAANFVLFTTPKSPIFFVFTPRINIRLFSAQGAPVKSPSYMPGGTLYFRLNRNFYKPEFLSLSYNHHSNGIRGPTLNPNGTFNTDSGKFTTNFYTLTYHTGKRIDKADLIINRYDALGLELHSALLGKGYSAALAGKYGFVRVNGEWIYNIAKAYPDQLDAGKKRFQNWKRIQFNFQYIADKYDNYNNLDLKKRLNLTLKYYYQFSFMQNVSFFAGGGYRAQDEYNIFFQDSYAYFTVGVASGLSFDFKK